SIYNIFDQIADSDKIPVFGIRNLSDEAIKVIKEKGYTVKLLGKAERTEFGIKAYIMPHLLRKDNVFSQVDSNLNILSATSDYLGTASFIGQGAGSLPTGHAIIQDLEDLKEKDFEIRRRKKVAKLNNEIYGRWFIVHDDIIKFRKLMAENLAENTFITDYCCLKDILKIFKKYPDDKAFIAEVADD
ncbi:MAG: hypothetical protein K6A70_09105, partial [Erysipelotrichaceae bacterium]|nr:hypothetical protein [Erysipelotrichaceae bacterium]